MQLKKLLGGRHNFALYSTIPKFRMTLSFNGDNEEWRYLRLSKVVQIMSILDPELQDSISHLHDHEGCLRVTWTHPMSISDEGKSTLHQIWRLLGDEQIEHEIFEQ